MTKADWLACTKPKMLLRSAGSRISDRKRRLFAAACCRRVWNLLSDERSQRAVETVERFADDAATSEELSAAEKAAAEAELATATDSHRFAANAVYAIACQIVGWDIAEMVVGCAANTIRAVGKRRAATEEEAAQVALLRDIVGNPFRPITLAPAHRTAAVLSLARAAYDERHLPSGELDPHRLAVLADALEAAGVRGELTAHLRGPRPHVRGCWPVDLCLGLS